MNYVTVTPFNLKLNSCTKLMADKRVTQIKRWCIIGNSLLYSNILLCFLNLIVILLHKAPFHA